MKDDGIKLKKKMVDN